MRGGSMKLFTFDCNYIPTEAIDYNIGTPLGQVTTYILIWTI